VFQTDCQDFDFSPIYRNPRIPGIAISPKSEKNTDKLAHFGLIAIPGMRGFRYIDEKTKSRQSV